MKGGRKYSMHLWKQSTVLVLRGQEKDPKIAAEKGQKSQIIFIPNIKGPFFFKVKIVTRKLFSILKFHQVFIPFLPWSLTVEKSLPLAKKKKKKSLLQEKYV